MGTTSAGEVTMPVPTGVVSIRGGTGVLAPEIEDRDTPEGGFAAANPSEDRVCTEFLEPM